MTLRFAPLSLAGVFVAASAFAAAGKPTAATTVIDATPRIDRSLPDCGLQRVIDEAAAEEGGAVVRLPAGIFALRRGLVLKSHVEIQGAGMDKTIFTPARRVERMEITQTSPDADGLYHVSAIPKGAEPGCAVVLWRGFPPGHAGYQRVAWIEALDREAKTLRLNTPYGLPTKTLSPGQQLLNFGVCLALEKDLKKGESEVTFKNASMLRAGDEIALGEPGNDSRDRQAFVKSVQGNVVTLETPAQSDLGAWQGKGWMCVTAMPWALHPCIHGWEVADAAIRDLTIQGTGLEPIHPALTRYTLSGIHFFTARRVSIERVAIRDWPADGFSIQTGEAVLVRDCEATNVLGNGFHPGTAISACLFEDCLGERCGSGFYFCWSNQGHTLRNCRFVKNRGGGITGLGNPNDHDNTIEECLIAENGGPGIEINGGQQSGNVIRDNTIENNSRAKAGQHPGIALYASTEDACKYTITGNTIRDTQEQPTQQVGIEERNGTYQKKPTRADENTIRGNTYAGHKTADVVAVGSKTVIEEDAKVTVVRRSQETQEVAP